MKYTIRLLKESSQIIPLMMVVQEIAKGFATRWGELPFRRRTFNETKRRWSAKMVDAAKRGELRVCDSDGFAIQAINDDLTQEKVISDDDMASMCNAHPECQIAPDVWNFAGVDFGTRIKIEAAPVGLFITLMQLNEWAASRGDSFTIEEMPADIMDINGMDCIIGRDGDMPKVGAGSGDEAVKVGGDATAASTLPVGIPTGTIIERFKLTDAWIDKLKHISRNPFLRAALMREGCRKSGKTPMTPHLWNPVVLAEILIKRDGRNRRAMETIITHRFTDWQDVWHESMESDGADEYAA